MSVGSTHHLEVVFVWKQNYILVDEYFFFCCTWIVNSAYKIINDQKISRGNGHFISIMVNNYRTHCGVVDINLNFFNDILYSVRLKNISKLENMEFCATKQRVYFSDKNKKASYKIINYGDYYDVDYYDNNLKNEVFDWIGKWS
ncbi:hypothetical protein [Escherichia coli]|uniref:YdcD family protein n=2 Tax=Escherichia coli TaxID=562 RepID=UPI00287BA7A1|nr:hypothetical protein [Escherichia coli]